MSIDLHIHTTCSDGLLTPEQVVRKAVQLNLNAIAITDHDTTDGITRALQEAKSTNIEVIPGIEINTNYNGHEIHILGYYLDYQGNYINDILKDLQQKRVNRAKKIVYKLKNLGFDISYDEIRTIALGPSVGRPHIAQMMINKHYVNTIKEAFEKYLGESAPAYVPRTKLTPFEAIDIIKNAKGIPVLAHPGLLEEHSIIKELIDYGIMGLEAYHTKHDDVTTQNVINIAKEKDLLITGGSDSHGEEPLLLGALPIPNKILFELKKYKNRIGI